MTSDDEVRPASDGSWRGLTLPDEGAQLLARTEDDGSVVVSMAALLDDAEIHFRLSPDQFRALLSEWNSLGDRADDIAWDG